MVQREAVSNKESMGIKRFIWWIVYSSFSFDFKDEL